MTLAEAADWALVHFLAADNSNAAIHTAPVRYSPITFRLAEALHEEGYDSAAVDEVLSHSGKYEEDKGR